MVADILVVDDDPATGQIIRLALAAEGYTVTSLTDGRQVLPLLAQALPAVVLLDLHMPLISGWEVHAHIKQAGFAVPVLYMTTGVRAQEEAERFGAAGFLTKPFDLDDLVAVARRFAGTPAQHAGVS